MRVATLTAGLVLWMILVGASVRYQEQRLLQERQRSVIKALLQYMQ